MSAKKRSDGRAGHRTKAEQAKTIEVDLDAAIAGEVEIPEPPRKEAVVDLDTGLVVEEEKPLWHPVAEALYMSLTKSGQSIYYEPSDWMTAYALCEALSREFKPKPVVVTSEDGSSEVEWVTGPVNGAVMAQVLKGLSALMATEGERRRLNLELERKRARDAQIAQDGKVTSITQRREDIFS